MDKDRVVYVLDTNVLVDYVDVIPGEGEELPSEPTIDLSHEHLLIPTVVIRELSNFKSENSDRGKAARTLLRRLRVLFENEIHKMSDVYKLRAPIKTSNGQQQISILPVHKDFWKCLPFHPSDHDMDGQIILTAIAASMAQKDLRIDGGELPEAINSTSFDDIVLLTNDNGLAIRARERGLKTARYGYKFPAPYTGRREIVATPELFRDFINSAGDGVTREFFEEQMPDEPKLIANEFVVMHLDDLKDLPTGYHPDEDPYFQYIGRYDANLDAVMPLQYTSSFPVPAKNPGQAIYAEALMSPDIAVVICTGPAGSGKTYMATIFGYEACQAGRFLGVTAVPCENRSNIGALPGDLDEKMDPDVQPLKNALRNYFLHNVPKFRKELSNLEKHGATSAEAKRYKKNNVDDEAASKGKTSLKSRLKDKVDNVWNNWFDNVPIDVARGRDFSHELAIYDEFQDQNAVQADTLIKRIGRDGKIILTGDIEQIHAPYLDRTNNGLVYASRQLFDNPMVAQVHFVEDEIVRHPLVMEIAKRQYAASQKH